MSDDAPDLTPDFWESVGTHAVPPRLNSPPTADIAAAAAGHTQTEQFGGARSWAANGDSYWGISHSVASIPPGCYRIDLSQSVGVVMQAVPLSTDALLRLPDSKSEQIIHEITQFTTLRPAFTQRGLLYKRGVLLWGPPGSGKTSTLHLLMQLIVDQLGGIAILVNNPVLAAMAFQLVRKIEPNRQIIAILEDMDGLVHNHGVEMFLALLDGEAQVDNVIFVATTNYPERLDRRFVDRPSRFDTVEYVGMPSADARRVYLRHKEPTLSDDVIEQMVASTEGLSIAHLREMIVLTQCFGRSVEEAAERLSRFKKHLPDSDRPPGRDGRIGLTTARRAPNPNNGFSGGLGEAVRNMHADLMTALETRDCASEEPPPGCMGDLE